MNSAPISPQPPSSSSRTESTSPPQDASSVSGSWEYNGATVSWETSDPYSVTLTVQGATDTVTLTRSAPQAPLSGMPLKTEARLDFSSLTQAGMSGTASIILLIQLAPDILFRTSIGGWFIDKSPDQPDTLSPWWAAPTSPEDASPNEDREPRGPQLKVDSASAEPGEPLPKAGAPRPESPPPQPKGGDFNIP